MSQELVEGVHLWKSSKMEHIYPNLGPKCRFFAFISVANIFKHGYRTLNLKCSIFGSADSLQGFFENIEGCYMITCEKK